MSPLTFIKSLFTKAPKHVYKLRPDVADSRDFLYSAAVPALTLPPHVDLRSSMPAVFDQGQLGSCTANALIAYAMFLFKSKGDSTLLSRLMLYYVERSMEGTVSEDAGAMIRDGVKALNQTGAAAETLWPYNISLFTSKPPDVAYTDAATRKVSSYHRVANLTELKTSLAAGFPVVIGFQVPASFESASVAKKGVMPMPKKNEKFLGGHAVLVIGYDDASNVLIVRNSWGDSWGQKGYFTMPYNFFNTPNMVNDCWTIRL